MKKIIKVLPTDLVPENGKFLFVREEYIYPDTTEQSYVSDASQYARSLDPVPVLYYEVDYK